MTAWAPLRFWGHVEAVSRQVEKNKMSEKKNYPFSESTLVL